MAGDRVPTRWLAGLALVVGDVLVVAETYVDNVLVVPQAYEGPAALLSIVTNPLWIPWRVMYTSGHVLLAVGIAYLAVALYRRGESLLATASGAALALGATLHVLEFVVAGIAAPSLFARPRGTMLTQEQVQLLLMGYKSIGIGLLAVASLAYGVALVLVGVGLYRTDLIHPVLAIGGVVSGGLFLLNGAGRVVSLPLGTVMVLLLSAVVILWFLALGGRLLRSPLAG